MLSTQSRTAHSTSKPGATLPVFIVTRYRHEDVAAMWSGSANREVSS